MGYSKLEHMQLWIETEERLYGAANTRAERRMGIGN